MTSLQKSIAQAASVAEADQVLTQPLKVIGGENAKRRIEDVIGLISETETGRQTLEAAAKAGYTVSVGYQGDRVSGIDTEKKNIVLDTRNKSEDLAAALIHDCRVAGSKYGPADDRQPRNETVKTDIIRARAVEADAQATVIQTLAEISVKGHGSYWANYRDNPENKSVVKAFKQGLKKQGSMKDGSARMAAFMGWYGNEDAKKAVDETQVSIMKKRQDRGDVKNDTYAATRPAAQIVKDVCVNKDGGCYFTADPKVLESGSYIAVNRETAIQLEAFIHRAPAAKRCVENDPTGTKFSKSMSPAMAQALAANKGRN